MKPDEVLLSLHDVGVRFGDVQALQGVSLAVNAGDVIALVGSNGCGKTTLLRALHGVIRHRGERRVHRTPLRQAMVFQRPFMLRLSALANVKLALWLAGVPAEERAERAERALARVGLPSSRSGRHARCRAGSSSASRSRGPGRRSRRSCSSTSRRRASTPRRRRRSRRCSPASRPMA